MAINVGINGFGRIGRIIFRTCLHDPGLKVSAINDPAVDVEYICYLIKFDSTHGKFQGTVEQCENEIIVDGNKIAIYREKFPTNIPWQLADVQYVVEASGMFTNLEKASGHLASEGVKRVVVTAPSVDVPMVILGVNDDKINSGHKVISSASSTLYCLAPIIKILEDNFGVSGGFITSIHAMTPSLKPLDGLCLKGKHWRDHRSIHQNIIPATTGACRALGKIIPQVKDKMSGLAFRVPIVNVSVLDITIQLKSSTTMANIIDNVENAGQGNMRNVIKISDEEAVSSDFIGDSYSCILDINSSLQLSPNFFKLICWYENEYSYARRVIDSIFFMEKQYQLQWQVKMAYMRPTPIQSLIHQSVCHKKQTDLTYNNECKVDPKILCSTSQNTGLKTQSPKRQPLKKAIITRNFGTRQIPGTSHEQKKKNEIFKIWNDGDEIIRGPLRQNRSSFFHSCVAISPHCNNKNIYAKTQERLNNVKKEFSKMVSMTENLLKKSNHDKIQGSLLKCSLNDEAGDADINVSNHSIKKDGVTNFNKSSTLAIVNNDNGPANTCNTLNIFVANKQEESARKVLINNNKDLTINNIKKYPLPAVKDIDTNALTSVVKNEKEVNIEILEFNKNELRVIEQPQEVNDSFQISQFKDLTILEPLSVEKSNENILNIQPNATCVQHIKIKEIQKEVIDVTPVQGRVLHRENIISNNCDKNKKEITNNIRMKSNNKEDTTVMDCKVKTESTLLQETNVKNIPDMNNLAKERSIQECNHKDRNLHKRLEEILNKLNVNSTVSEKASPCLSSDHTISTLSNRGVKHKQDIYDKLDSVSATDSENSFHMNERKSQVIDIADLTNSLEDLERLDQICRIIEISDELSDKLLSALNNNKCNDMKSNRWSFKDMCERIKLDDFCNKIFSKSKV